MQNYYDVLSVSREASAEVIRAAYRALSQKYHPDRNPHDAAANQRMIEINQAYAVLSDPEQRRQHDLWIARHALQAQVSPVLLARRQTPFEPSAPLLQLPEKPASMVTLHERNSVWLWLLGIALVAVFGIVWWRVAQPQAPVMVENQHTPVLLAPNGQLFPLKAAYVSGYPLVNQRGDNEINVDASALPVPVFAQLYALQNNKLVAIRSFYLPAGESFTLKKIGDGDFSLQYQRLNDGQWQVSDIIRIRHTEASHQYRQIAINL
ncbi:J domain-containing protein [Neisseriaceae bacterium ESL0693]|nr:J domain-containing protein [Neisseriaceae bacterium ESL0693]